MTHEYSEKEERERAMEGIHAIFGLLKCICGLVFVITYFFC